MKFDFTTIKEDFNSNKEIKKKVERGIRFTLHFNLLNRGIN
jgi:hypothetical protein